MLQEQEGRAGVDGEEAVPELDAGVVQRAARAQARGVDEAVQPPEPLVAGADDRAAIVGLGEVAGDEHALALQRVAHGHAPLAVAAADDDAGRPQPCDAPRDGGAKALCAAGHDDDLAVEALIGEQVVHAGSTSSTRTGRPSRTDRHAASPMTSGARASTGPTGGIRSVLTASTNAPHSRR